MLGSQPGMNSAYFFQGNINKLQMTGVKEITNGVQPIVVGDYVGVRIDFEHNQILYYNNDVLQGFL